MSEYPKRYMHPNSGPPQMPTASQFTPGPNWPKPQGNSFQNVHSPPVPNQPNPEKHPQKLNPHQPHYYKAAKPKPKNPILPNPQPIPAPQHSGHNIRPPHPIPKSHRMRSRSAHMKVPPPEAVEPSNFPLQRHASQTSVLLPPDTGSPLPGEIDLEALRHLLDENPEVILTKLRFEDIGFWELVNRPKGFLDDEVVILVILVVNKAIQCLKYKENLQALLSQLMRSHLVRIRLPYGLRRQMTYKRQGHRFQLFLLEALVGFFKACSDHVPKEFEKVIGPSLILTSEIVKSQLIPGNKFKQKNILDLMNIISSHNIPVNCADSFKVERYPGVPGTVMPDTPTMATPEKNVKKLAKPKPDLNVATPPAEQQPKVKMPNSPFRHMDRVPSLKDLVEVVSGMSMLQNMRMDTRFSSIEDYLENHFKFLRYELLAPLKEVIAKMKSVGELVKLMPSAVVQEMRVPHAYPGTVITSMELTSFGVICTLSVKMEFITNINWSYGNNFLSGSLLCLSHNDFATGLWASVVRRDVTQLKKGIVKVWIIQPERSFRQLANDREYMMIENCQNFEATDKILAGLQSQIEFWTPLGNVILNGNCNTGVPGYLEKFGDETKFQLRPAYPTINWMSIPGLGLVTMKEFLSWPHKRKLDLDDWQYAALHDALTKQVSLINGASGTGKKYLASKIGQVLVHNSSLNINAFQGPLVFICESVVALDHFIQNLQKSNITEIIRFGGESGDDSAACLRSCNFYEIKSARKAAKPGKAKKDSVARREARSRAAKIINLQKTINRCCSGILGERVSLIFGNDLQNHENGQQALCHWLLEGTPRIYGTTKPAATTSSVTSTVADTVGNFEEELRLIHGEMTRYEPYIKVNFDKDEPENTEHTESWSSIRGLLLHQMSNDDVMTSEEENKIDNIWNLAPKDRWRLYRKRVNDLKKISETCLKEHFVAYSKCLEDLRKCKIQSQADFLKNYKVVALTVTGAVKFLPTLQALKPSVLLVQEAGAIPEELLVTMMTKECQHLIMVGDLNQQWPRLTRSKSLFERLASEKGFECKQLNIQYSMSENTMQLLNLQRSERIVTAHSSVLNMKPVKGMAKNVYFLAHNNRDETISGEDEKNSFEAEYAAALCRYLVQQGYTDKSIAILTTTTAQVMAIRSNLSGLEAEVTVTVVDHWQGQRSDIVIVSMVRSGQEESDMSVAEKRFQLAFTRARIGIYCFVNVNYLAKNVSLWQPFLSFLNQEDLIGNAFRIKCENHPMINLEISCPQDFQIKAPNGGCNLSCIRRMPCGHLCSLRCHSSDLDHKKAVLSCREPCSKTICLSGHKCKKLCSEECNVCQEVISVTLSKCNHTVSVRCNENYLQLKCSEPCERNPFDCEHSCPCTCGEECPKRCEKDRVVVSQCGHVITVPCYLAKDESDVRSICTAECLAKLPCGHLCTGTCGKCYQGVLHQRCMEKCKSVIQLCGHVCGAPCHQQCPPCRQPCEVKCPHGYCKKPCGIPCEPCREPCPVTCSHSKCTKTCGEPCDTPPCDVPCTKPSKVCQHPCVGLCGDICPPNCGICSRGPEYVVRFGTENNFARYIYLKDCGHVLEVTGMDRWMTTDDSSLSNRMDKCCPACLEPIFHSVRYHKYTNKAIENIINEKMKTFGNPIMLISEKATLVNRAIVHNELFPKAVAKIVFVLEKNISQYELSLVRDIIGIVSDMSALMSSLSEDAIQVEAIKTKVLAMQDVVMQMMDVEDINGFSVVSFGSRSQFDTLKLEITRIDCLRCVNECLPKKSSDSVNQKAKPLIDASLALLTSGKCFTTSAEDAVKKAISLVKQLERPFLCYLVKESDILDVLKLIDDIKQQYKAQ